MFAGRERGLPELLSVWSWAGFGAAGEGSAKVRLRHGTARQGQHEEELTREAFSCVFDSPRSLVLFSLSWSNSTCRCLALPQDFLAIDTFTVERFCGCPISGCAVLGATMGSARLPRGGTALGADPPAWKGSPRRLE